MTAYGFDHRCPTSNACLLYVQCLVNSFKNITSIKNYLSGAKTFLSMAGGDPTPLSSAIIGTVLRGAARLSTHIPAPAPPLPRYVLTRLCQALRSLGGDGKVAMAAVLFGVTTFLRQSNFLPSSIGQVSPHLVRRQDVHHRNGSLWVVIRSTKTRLASKGPLTLLIAPAPGSPLCPVAACLAAWKAVPAPVTAPLFLLPSTGRPLTPPGLVALLRATLQAMGEPLGRDLTVHSLRRTGALLAAGQGVPDADVMQHGTWTSGAYRAYVPPPISSSVPAAMATVWQ